MSGRIGVTRRRFVVLAGVGGAGLTIGLAPARGTTRNAATIAFAQPFVRIGTDDTVTVLAKHLDMGQGIWTGLASIVAEELDASWAQMRVEGAPADRALYKNLIFGFQTTGGSTSTANSWEQMRRAGATARAMLVEAAAGLWGVAPADVEVAEGVVRSGSRRASFGELAALAATKPVPATTTLKDPARFRIVGQDVHRLDAVAKTHGEPIFGIDVERPGMRVAVLQRAPRFGAVVRSFDDRATRAVRDVLDVVRVPNGVAVIAAHTWAAIAGRRALVVEWDETGAETRSSSEIAAEFRRAASMDEGVVCLQRGDAAAAMARAAQVVEATFELPYLAHAAMEPLCGVAEMRDGTCDIWAGIQNQSGDQAAAARILGLAPERVRLHTLYAGGSFGRRATFASDWIGELAEVLKASGATTPIKLMWTREDDMTGGYYRPLNVHALRAGLDDAGRLIALEHVIAAQSFLFGPPKAGVAQRPDPTVFEGHVAARYDVADARLRWVNMRVGVPVQMFRALSHNHTTFTKEVLMDELARRARRDALDYRLDHLAGHPRQAAVLRLAAEKAGWRESRTAGRALGLAVQEANNGTFVAQVVEAAIEGGAIRVHRVVCAVDCGTVVNPDIVRAQVEGGIAFGLTQALHGELTLKDGRVVETNFDRYRVLRMPEMPRSIEVHVVDGGGRAPTGIGEPGSVLAAAALANAVASLTGRPVRSLPLSLA